MSREEMSILFVGAVGIGTWVAFAIHHCINNDITLRDIIEKLRP